MWALLVLTRRIRWVLLAILRVVVALAIMRWRLRRRRLFLALSLNWYTFFDAPKPPFALFLDLFECLMTC
jgi:hypothetical protein